MSTIRQVAKHAGVSTMTVSRAVNNSGYISQEAHARVEAAVAELGYVPNTLATSLRYRQTNTLALLLTDITNPFFTTVARGVEDAASEQGFSVIFANTDESEQEQSDHLTVLVRKRVDGVLLVPARSAAEPVRFLQRHRVPVVVLDRCVPGAAADVVRCDSEQGAYDCAAPAEPGTPADRGPGRAAGCLHGRGPGGRLPPRAGRGRRGRKRKWPDPPRRIHPGRRPRDDAAGTGPDAAPHRVLRRQQLHRHRGVPRPARRGAPVPEDMAMAAFDDLPPTLVLEPFLTVASQPAYDMGRRATELLLARLAGTGPAGYRRSCCPPS